MIRLKSFRVTEFQSVNDSGPVIIGNVTCLVGKNEAGKSALLKALYRLNPLKGADAKFDVAEDYPRMNVSQYEYDVDKKVRPAAQAVEGTFTLDEVAKREIAAVFGPKFLLSDDVKLHRYYGNKSTYTMTCDEKAGMAYLIRSASEDAKGSALGAANLEAFKSALSEFAGEATVAAALKIVEMTDGKALSYYAYNTVIDGKLPKFLYFDEYSQMKGHENLDALKERMEQDDLLPSDYPLVGLIELARLDIDQLLNPGRTLELKNRLQGAGNHLTKAILKYWSQNRHLQMQFDVRPAQPHDPEGMKKGVNIWAEVYDSHHAVSTGLGTRSRGFVWFFSFIAWYSKVMKEESNVILLLDEPGLTLHGRAQADLLRYFENELAPNNQLIYTTHSPFLVDPDHFDRVRIVQDRSIDETDLRDDQAGTKVLGDVFAANDDSLFPLQGALGYDIHQTLFVGPNNLMVEGPSDLIYIQLMSSALDRDGRAGLSPKWTVSPVGGSSKIATYAKLLVGQKGMKLAALIDIQKKDAQSIANLYKEKLLKKNHTLTFAEFTGTIEADIEDMFERDFYIKMVNAEYKSQLEKPIILADLASSSPRIVVAIEEFLKAKPLKSGVFTHYRVARYLQENASGLMPSCSNDTLKKFEAAFGALNKLLN